MIEKWKISIKKYKEKQESLETELDEANKKIYVYDEYYYPIPSDRDLWESRLWIGDNYDNSRFSRGLVCKTKEEAIDMAKKMLAVVKEEQK